jgi:hypothetical protein
VTMKDSTGRNDPSGPWQAKLGDLTINGEGSVWPVTAAGMKMPYNLRVLQLGVTGKGAITADNTSAINKVLGNPSKSDGGCTMASPEGDGISIGWAGMLLMAPLLSLLRRRRQRQRN